MTSFLQLLSSRLVANEHQGSQIPSKGEYRQQLGLCVGLNTSEQKEPDTSFQTVRKNMPDQIRQKNIPKVITIYNLLMFVGPQIILAVSSFSAEPPLRITAIYCSSVWWYVSVPWSGLLFRRYCQARSGSSSSVRLLWSSKARRLISLLRSVRRHLHLHRYGT